MEQNVRQVTLTGLADGAVEELFIDAMAKVLDNIADINTDHKVKRMISLDFIVMADEERRVGNIEVVCSTKLAGVKGVNVGVYLGMQDGLRVAVEGPRQTDLFPTPKSLLRSAGVKEGAKE